MSLAPSLRPHRVLMALTGPHSSLGQRHRQGFLSGFVALSLRRASRSNAAAKERAGPASFL